MYILRDKRVRTRMIAGLHLTITLYLQYNTTFLYSKTKQLLRCIGILFNDQIINHNTPQLSYLGFLLWSLIYNETHVLGGIWREPLPTLTREHYLLFVRVPNRGFGPVRSVRNMHFVYWRWSY